MQARVPKPVRSVDVRGLPLTSVEGYVLSRVDGSTTVEDISMISGIDEHTLLGILDRLADLGVVNLSWLPGRQRDAARQIMMSQEPVARAPDAHFGARRPRYREDELDGDIDLPMQARRRILDALYAIEGRDFYSLLGVPRKADKKAIRNAYFELSKIFHPDAHFGKDLGHFKTKMETVFKALTEAYEVLGKPKKRAEYDEYLATTEQAKEARQTLDSIEFAAVDVQAHRQAAMEPEPPTSSVEAARHRGLKAPPVPRFDEEAKHSIPAGPSNEERRARVRDRLRQRLRAVSSQQPPTASSSSPAQSPEEKRHSIIEGLKESIKQSAVLSGTPAAQVQSYLKKAHDAERGGDVLLATKELSQALALDPNSPELAAEYARVSKVVARNLAANYEKQALYEEKAGKWRAAANSWARVSDGRPDDNDAARRAAEAMLKSSGDLHRAQKYAELAVRLENRSVPNLTVLARVYLAAGLKLNALRELEKAVHLAPKDELVNNLLREAR